MWKQERKVEGYDVRDGGGEYSPSWYLSLCGIWSLPHDPGTLPSSLSTLMKIPLITGPGASFVLFYFMPVQYFVLFTINFVRCCHLGSAEVTIREEHESILS